METMRAAVMRDRRLVVAEVPIPQPGPGEVLARTLACGICGSDLHALKFADQFVATAKRAGNPRVMDLSRDVIMGHEFCAEIVDHGPRASRVFRAGTRVCSRPVLMPPTGPQSIGYSNDNPGGYAQYMRLSEALLLEVPNGLPSDQAALTEPMAVGVHAVAKARLEFDDAPLVIGCGPVGLAVIAALRLAGARPIVAADFSKRRRELAVAVGADVVVDPAQTTPWQSWREAAAVWKDPARAPQPPPWMPGPPLRPAVVFECVGVPGMLDQLMAAAPLADRRGRRVHGGGHDLPDARHHQGAEPALRPRLHAGRVRHHAAQHRRGPDSHGAADHRPRRREWGGTGLRGARLAGATRQDPGASRTLTAALESGKAWELVQVNSEG
jgi:threonine dehydrogenase-like Zn-dependent dehydrogenase